MISRSALGAPVLAFALTVTACAPPAPAGDPTISAAPSSTAAETPEPDAPGAAPTRPSGTLTDASIRGRLAAPRTGETWHAPVLFDASGLTGLDGSNQSWGETTYTYAEVGERAGYPIVVAIATPDYSGYGVHFIYEIRDGNPVEIVCPRAYGSPWCGQQQAELAQDGIAADEDVFYDSLTFPDSFELAPGFTVTGPSEEWQLGGWELGDGEGILRQVKPRAIKGERPKRSVFLMEALPAADGSTSARVDEVRTIGDVKSAPTLTYELVTPFGSRVRLAETELAYGAIEWNDGWVAEDLTEWGEGWQREFVRPVSSNYCTSFGWSVDADRAPGQWVEAGVNPSGWPVYLPKASNALAAAVFEAHRSLDSAYDSDDYEEESSTRQPGRPSGFGYSRGVRMDGGPNPYVFRTFDEFLAARTLVATLRPDGMWLVGVRGDSDTGGTCGE